MANYLYNGVELPDINEVWTDKETYPYAVIMEYTDSVSLYLSSTILTFADNRVVVNADGNVALYEIANETWEYATGSPVTSGTVIDHANYVLWTSHDILNEDGTVYLAASEPKIYNTKISVDFSNTEGMTIVNDIVIKISEVAPTESELSTSWLIYQLDDEVISSSCTSYESVNSGDAIYARYYNDIAMLACYNAPVTVEDLIIPEKGLYLAYGKDVSVSVDFYYNSTSTEEPDTPTFDTRSFQIGIAVGMGLKGNFGSPIDTGVNSAFTKGVEIGQRIRGYLPDIPTSEEGGLKFKDGVLTIEGDSYLSNDGVLNLMGVTISKEGILS